MSYLPDPVSLPAPQDALNSNGQFSLVSAPQLNQQILTQQSANPQNIGLQTVGSQTSRQRIAFVDSGLDDIETLIKGLENTRVVLVDEQQNGIERITAELAQYENISEVHIFSHGSSGAIKLGSTLLNGSSIQDYSSDLQQWQRSLSSNADLLFYGCNFAATDEGVALIDRISRLSGADVAASNDLSGIGGDWQLEVTRGEIESDIALSRDAQAAYKGTLSLLNNGGFEVGLSNWTRFTNTETVSSTVTFSGVRSLRLSQAASGVSQTVAVTAGETYQLSGTAKSSAQGYAAIGLRFFDADFNAVGYSDVLIESDQWQDYQLEDVAPEGAAFAQVWAYKHPNGGELFVDNLVFDTDAIAPPNPPTAGEELLENADFESGLNNWGKFTGSESSSAIDPLSGNSALQLSTAGSGVSQFVRAIPGETYNLSGYGKSTSTNYVGLGLNFYDGDYNFLGVRASAQVLSDQWTLYQRSATAPVGTVYAQVWTYRSNAEGDAFFDQFSLTRDGGAPTDTAAPTATLSASDLSAEGQTAYEFSVTYADETAVDVASLGRGDVRVLGPNGFAQTADLLAVDVAENGTPRTATYRISAPNATWSESDNGLYSVRLQRDQVADTLGNAAAAVDIGEFSVAITDTPEPDYGFIGLQSSTLSVDEAAGSVQVTVLRTGGSDGEVTVDYRTVDSTGRAATRDQDYIDSSGTLTFANGQTEQSVLIPIVDDGLAEGAETFGFAIDNVGGGATLLAPRTAQITINDNDTLSYRGNQYVLTASAKTWVQAQAEAESLGGNLVTINAAAEEAWLKQNFGDERFWIGLNDVAEEGTFEWASGEALTYINWAPNEPNNSGNQDFVTMNFGASRQWDDDSAFSQYLGIIEIGDSNAPPESQGNGLKGEYFNNKDFTNRAITRTDANIEFNWGTGSPDPSIGRETFSVRWTGRIEPLYSETYTFRTDTDDGVRLWVNNQLIIDQFVNQARTQHTGNITLSAGQKYDIRMEYFENTGGASAQLSWSSASQPVEVIPRSQLFSEPISSNAPIPETVVSALSLPTAIDWRAGSDQMFIAEKGGKVKVYENDEVLSEPFIDISNQVNGTRDRGLLDLALHPDFVNNPYVYLLFTYDPPEVFNNTGEAGPDGKNNRASRLIRVTADAANGYRTAVANSEVVLLGKNSTWDNYNGFVNSTVDLDEPEAGVLPDGSYLQDFLNADSESHTIGAVEFGPDGALYVSNGDGASYNRVDPRAARVQDVDSLSGKILRIDPITGKGLSDNPFFNGDADANRSKVYQLGLRNPFRMTIDPDDGQIYIGDVGWTKWEEINAAGAGANFGWPYYEGGNGESLPTGGYADLPEAQDFYQNGPSVAPSLLGLNHRDDGINAIVMGDIYKGTVYDQAYQGDLFFNDLGQGIVRNVSLDANGNVASVDTFATGTSYVVQMIEGPDELLYYVNLVNGTVGRWVFS